MVTKTYDSILVGKYLMALAYKKDIRLNVTKVQKLLYIAYGIVLAKKEYHLFDEQPKAWPYGPVLPKTRNIFKEDKVYKLEDEEFDEIKKDEIATAILNYVIDKYSKFSASQLTEWSHEKDSPWDKTKRQKDFDWNQPIRDEYIKDYFNRIFS